MHDDLKRIVRQQRAMDTCECALSLHNELHLELAKAVDIAKKLDKYYDRFMAEIAQWAMEHNAVVRLSAPAAQWLAKWLAESVAETQT